MPANRKEYGSSDRFTYRYRMNLHPWQNKPDKWKLSEGQKHTYQPGSYAFFIDNCCCEEFCNVMETKSECFVGNKARVTDRQLNK